MTKHEVGTREEWLAARVELLESEKELTRRSDELARQRRELPWVRVDKEYTFETDEGPKTDERVKKTQGHAAYYAIMVTMLLILVVVWSDTLSLIHI